MLYNKPQITKSKSALKEQSSGRLQNWMTSKIYWGDPRFVV